MAVVALALGIGANVAIFSATYAVLLGPLPWPDQGRLVVPVSTNAERRDAARVDPVVALRAD